MKVIGISPLDKDSTITLVEDGTDRILGAHLLGIHAEEVVNLFALAIRTGLSAHDLKEMVFSYPTGASDVRYMI